MAEPIDPAVQEMLDTLADALGDEAVISVIDVYDENSAIQLKQMEEAVIYSNMDRLRHEAHSLKSSSANLGAADLATRCSQIEKSPDFTPAVAELVVVCKDLREKAMVSMHRWKQSKAS